MNEPLFQKLIADESPDALTATTADGEMPARVRYRDLLQSAPDAIVIVDGTGRLILVNARAEAMFGYRRAELLGKPVEILLPASSDAVHLRYRQQCLGEFRSPGEAGPLEADGVRKNGEKFPVEMTLSWLHTEEGALGMSSIRDVTERKTFDRSQQTANRMKSEFLGSMSHELRTPLNGIIGFTEFLIDGKPGPLNEKQKEYLTDVHNSGKHLLQLINDVLDLAKVEAGKVELNPETFQVSKAVDEVCAIISGIAHKKGVEVAARIDPELEVTMDERKFKQICYNLVANAVKFTDAGGQVDIGAEQTGTDRFSVWVRDTGIGVMEDDLQGLFHEFKQVENGAAPRYEGAGLGLLLTKKLVEYQGGKIELESEYGAGSTFTVTLPMGWTEGGGDER